MALYTILLAIRSFVFAKIIKKSLFKQLFFYFPFTNKTLMSHFTIGITSTAEALLRPDYTEQPQIHKDLLLKLWVMLINYRSAIGLCGQYGYFALSSLVSGKVLLRSSMVIWSKGIMFLNFSSCQWQTTRGGKWLKCFIIVNFIKSQLINWWVLWENFISTGWQICYVIRHTDKLSS